MRNTFFPVFFILLSGLLFSIPGFSQNTYQHPPQAVEDLILAPATPAFSLSPRMDCYLIIRQTDIPSIQEQAQTELRLAGKRILAATNCPKIKTKIKHLEIKSLPGKKAKEGIITGFPASINIISYKWSPDGNHIAVCEEKQDGIYLWTADVSEQKARLLTKRKLNFFFGTGMYSWSPDSKHLVVALIPENRGAVLENKGQNIMPVIQTNEGKNNQAPTYQDLLTDTHSELLFDYYAKSELGIVSVENGQVIPNGKPAIYLPSTYSPDGKYLLVKHLIRPYSYVVPYTFFPSAVEIRKPSGQLVKQVYRKPLIEYEFLSNNSASPEPRGYEWRADKPASLFWIEPLDGGDGKNKVKFRDRIMLLDAPFTGQAMELIKTEKRYDGILWGDSRHAFLMTYDDNTRHKKCCLFDPSASGKTKVIYDQSAEDLYADYGKLITVPNAYGQPIVLSDDKYKTVYFSGRGFSPKGAYPFINAHHLNTNLSTRVWQSEDPWYEYPVAYPDLLKGEIIISRESNTETPNYYLLNIKKGKPIALTHFLNPYPGMKGVTKQIIEYTRNDGVKLSGTLYLPAGYQKEEGRLPVLIWAYPSEYKSSKNAGQRKDAPNQFIRYTRLSPILWVAEGYAVLNNASFPIIGEGKQEPNDTYIEQLVANAEAAVKKLVDMGIGDPKRIAVGGHSYGAFMTANLLANCDLFAAGIARSGAYNRTLTPFGFQNEMRTFWEAPEVYLKMSPFVKADKLKTPILLIHGQADNNTGTFTMQSERLYTALRGNGGIVRLVLLPYESHGYVAKESILHQAWETYRWLEKYVKNKH